MEAVFGLLGVVIGGLLSGVVNWVMEHRRERRAARVAARLLREDLYQVACRIEDAVEGAPWAQAEGCHFSDQLWAEQRIHLAAVMPYRDYAAVVQGIEAAKKFGAWAGADPAGSGNGEGSAARLNRWLGDLRDGLGALLRLAR